MTAIPTWHAAALCRTEPGDWFADSPAMVEQAKAVCGRCAVRDACLADAVARGEADGVWGGQSVSDRFAPLLLAEVAPVAHVASRGHYVQGCRLPECCALNTAYNADLRRRLPATAASRVETAEQLALDWSAA